MFFGNDCRYENDVNYIHKRNKTQYTENVLEYQKTVSSDYLIMENEDGMFEEMLICNTPSIEPKVIVPVCVGIRIYLSGIDYNGHSTKGVTVNIDGNYHCEFDYGIWMIKWGQSTTQLEQFCIQYYGMFSEIVDIVVGIESGPVASGVYNISRRICATFLEASNLVYPTNYIIDSIQDNMHFENNINL